MNNIKNTCAIDDCQRTIEARGWCSRHYDRWRRTGKPDDPQCRQCGEPIRINSSAYCGEICRGAGYEAAWRATHQRRKDDPARKEQVANASRRFHERAMADPDLLARRRAATADWRKRNAERMAETHRAWREDNAEKVRAKNQRRRARLLGAWVEDVDLEVVWHRDGGLCGICGIPVDPEIKWPHKQSRTLDHIIPLAAGGTHEYANSQLAHAVCNSRKSDALSVPHIPPTT